MISYDKLDTITKTSKPYRGSTNRYPTNKRTHNLKNFYVEELDGERVFKVTYGVTSRRIIIDEHEYLSIIKSNPHGAYSHNEEFYRYEPIPYEIGIVRPDNTFEFTAQNLHQGLNMYLSNEFFGAGLVCASVRHGGVVYNSRWRNPQKMFPLFKGLRLNLDTLTPHESHNLTLHKLNIDRKLSKALMADYGTMLKVSETMFKAMDLDTLITQTNEVVHEATNTKMDETVWAHGKNTELLQQAANQANKEGRYFDCAAIHAYLMDANRLQAVIKWNNNWYRNNMSTESIHMALKTNLAKQVYKAEEPFKKTEITYGLPYASSEWGFELLDNGKLVETRYY